MLSNYFLSRILSFHCHHNFKAKDFVNIVHQNYTIKTLPRDQVYKTNRWKLIYDKWTFMLSLFVDELTNYRFVQSQCCEVDILAVGI